MAPPPGSGMIDSNSPDLPVEENGMIFFPDLDCGPGNWPPPKVTESRQPGRKSDKYPKYYEDIITFEKLYSLHPELRLLEHQDQLLTEYKLARGIAADQHPHDTTQLSALLKNQMHAVMILKGMGFNCNGIGVSRKNKQLELEVRTFKAHMSFCKDNPPIKCGPSTTCPEVYPFAIPRQELEPKPPVLAKAGGNISVSAFNHGYSAGFNNRLKFTNTACAELKWKDAEIMELKRHIEKLEGKLGISPRDSGSLASSQQSKKPDSSDHRDRPQSTRVHSAQGTAQATPTPSASNLTLSTQSDSAENGSHAGRKQLKRKQPAYDVENGAQQGSHDTRPFKAPRLSGPSQVTQTQPALDLENGAQQESHDARPSKAPIGISLLSPPRHVVRHNGQRKGDNHSIAPGAVIPVGAHQAGSVSGDYQNAGFAKPLRATEPINHRQVGSNNGAHQNAGLTKPVQATKSTNPRQADNYLNEEGLGMSKGVRFQALDLEHLPAGLQRSVGIPDYLPRGLQGPNHIDDLRREQARRHEPAGGHEQRGQLEEMQLPIPAFEVGNHGEGLQGSGRDAEHQFQYERLLPRTPTSVRHAQSPSNFLPQEVVTLFVAPVEARNDQPRESEYPLEGLEGSGPDLASREATENEYPLEGLEGSGPDFASREATENIFGPGPPESYQITTPIVGGMLIEEQPENVGNEYQVQESESVAPPISSMHTEEELPNEPSLQLGQSPQIPVEEAMWDSSDGERDEDAEFLALVFT